MILYAGPLQMLYDRGFLRYIAYQEHEILRMMYFALRDEKWETAEHVIYHEEKDISWETFRISYQSFSTLNGENLMKWDCLIEGKPDASVKMQIEGTVLKDLKKNRAGMCVLHPLDGVLGQEADVTHTNGDIEHSFFPKQIAAENPFRDIKQLRWTFRGKRYELTFEGEIFETEDQRNWIDASFKTFCTPSHLPIPVSLHAGDKVRQCVTFRPLEKMPPITSHDLIVIQLEKTGTNTRLPKIGLCLSQAEHDTNAIAELQKLQLNHIRIDVEPLKENWTADYSRQCELAQKVGSPMKIALKLSGNYQDEIEAFAVLTSQNRIKPGMITILMQHPNQFDKFNEVAKELKKYFRDSLLGGGTDSDFKEINRNHFDSSELHFISFAAFPQVHAKDDRTIIENIEGISEAGSAAAALHKDKAIHVSPLTFHQRGLEDERFTSDFAGLWTFGALRAAANAKIQCLSIYETAGANGVVALDGTHHSTYAILEKLLHYRDHEMVVLKSSEPLMVDAMLFTSDRSTTLFLSNYTDDLQTVRYGRNEFQVLPNQVMEINLSST